MKKNEIPVAQNNDFDGLVAHIQQTQDVLQNNARLVINRHVTAKAWLTGYYIVPHFPYARTLSFVPLKAH